MKVAQTRTTSTRPFHGAVAGKAAFATTRSIWSATSRRPAIEITGDRRQLRQCLAPGGTRLEVALHIDRVVAERRLGLEPRRGDGLVEVVLGLGDLHAAPARAGRGLISTGNPISFAAANASSSVVTAPSEPGTTGMPRLHRLFGGDLVAHHLDVLGLGPDEVKP